MAAEYPDFQPQAQEIQNKLLLLKAAEQDAIKAREELKYLRNPELRPKVEGLSPILEQRYALNPAYGSYR